MNRSPTTFFFRLDAHQATLVRCMAQIAQYVTVFLLFCLAATYHDPTSKDEGHVSHKARALMGGDEGLNAAIIGAMIIVGYLLIKVFGATGALYAVLSQRNRWMMVPWFVMEALGFLFYTLLFLIIIMYLFSQGTQLLAIFLTNAFAFCFLGLDVYSWLAGISSFKEIGLAGRDVSFSSNQIKFQSMTSSESKSTLI